MLKNIFSNWTTIVFSTIAVFILYPFLVQTMGEDQYGVWLLITSITGYISILFFGVPVSNVRFISKYDAEKKHDKVNEVINTTLVFYSALAFVVLIGAVILYFVFEHFFKISDEFIFFAKISLFIVAAIYSLKFPFEIFGGIMHAFQNFVVLNGIYILRIILRVILTFMFVTYEDGLIVLALILAFVTLMESSLLLIYIRKKYTYLKFGIKYFSKEMLKQIFSYSIYALVLQMASLLAFQTDPVVIGAIISTSAIVYYSVAANFLTYLTEFVRGIGQALMPQVSSLDAVKNISKLRLIYINYSRLTYLIVLPVCLLLLSLGSDFISIWMGENFRKPSGEILTILTISYLFFLVQRGVGHALLMGISKLKFPTYLMASTSVVNLLISIYLGRIYGIAGVAWGTTIPNLIVTVIMIIYIVKILEINIFSYVFKTIILPSISSLFFLFPVILIKQYIAIDNYFIFMTTSATAFIVYAISVYFFFLKDEINNLLSSIRK